MFDNSDAVESQVDKIALDLCTHPSYDKWLQSVLNNVNSCWKGVGPELAKCDCPVDEILALDDEIATKFVYKCIPGPYFKSNGEVLIIFKIAGLIWNRVFELTPAEKNN